MHSHAPLTLSARYPFLGLEDRKRLNGIWQHCETDAAHVQELTLCRPTEPLWLGRVADGFVG